MEIKGVKPQLKKGLWKPEEDRILKSHVEAHGEGNWASVSKKSGLMRGGKSCRLRWKNYLRPNIKRGGMSDEEKDLIIRLHKLLGNRWSLIAGRLPGRTDNEVKNYWNTHFSKRSSQGKTTSGDPTQKNKLQQLPNSELICSRSSETDKEISHAVKEEELTVRSVWMHDTTSFIFDAEPPFLPANNAPPSLYDDEPFMPIFDPLALSEAFYKIDEEDNYQLEVSGHTTVLW